MRRERERERRGEKREKRERERRNELETDLKKHKGKETSSSPQGPRKPGQAPKPTQSTPSSGSRNSKDPSPFRSLSLGPCFSQRVNSQSSQDLIPRQSENTQALNKPSTLLTAASLRKNQFCLREAICTATFPDVGDNN